MRALTGMAIWTGRGAPITDGTVVVDDAGRIRDVVPGVPSDLGGDVERIAVPGGTVLPGFQDAHCHPLHGGLRQLQCDLTDADGRWACLEAVAAYAAARPDEPWIVGSGWRMPDFPAGLPRREDLDRVVPDRPVVLVNTDGHGAWVNTRSLELAGITDTTPDPVDGRIERDPDGTASGVLHEGAMALVRRVVPEPDADQLVAALRRAQAHLHGLGITAWTDAWVTPRELVAYQAMSDAGDLTARVTAALWWDRLRGLEQVDDLVAQRDATAGERLAAATVKIMQDGVVENTTAAMLDDYLDVDGAPTGDRGLRHLDPALLAEAVTVLDRVGFQVHVHAIGDAAVRDALDAFAAARRAGGDGARRHAIAHLQVVDPADLPRFAELDVVACAQPYWAQLEAQMVELTLPVLGPRRSALQYPWAGLRDHGARLTFGSDWPVSTADPLWGIEVATTRTDPERRGHEPFLPAERLPLADALAAATAGSAFQHHLDAGTGVIAPGMVADLVVLDGPLVGERARPPADLHVAVTMVGGEVVHRR